MDLVTFIVLATFITAGGKAQTFHRGFRMRYVVSIAIFTGKKNLSVYNFISGMSAWFFPYTFDRHSGPMGSGRSVSQASL